jgi:serine/threonine protein kinase
MPYCHAAGKQNNHNYSLLDLLSHNLHTLLHKCGGIFKIKTFLMIADQTLKLIEFLHRQGYIHRQVSLKKFAIGSAKNSKKLYLCGFGQGKRFKKEGE